MKKRILWVIFGFVSGFMVASGFFVPELRAQWTQNSGFKETLMSPAVPKSYGTLKAVQDLKMYFEGEGGNIYIIEPQNAGKLSSEVKVIKRGP